MALVGAVIKSISQAPALYMVRTIGPWPHSTSRDRGPMVRLRGPQPEDTRPMGPSHGFVRTKGYTFSIEDRLMQAGSSANEKPSQTVGSNGLFNVSSGGSGATYAVRTSCCGGEAMGATVGSGMITSLA